MKKLITLAAAIFLSVSGVAAAAPYADKIEVTSITSPISKMIIKAAKVPDRSSVGIPCYPGAKIFQTRDKGEVEINGQRHKTLAYIKLLSTDPVDKIVAWYKEQLKEYTYEDAFGMSVFWKGKGKFNGLDMRQRMTIQNVGISPAIDAMGYDKDMKGARSVIETTYE
mgnify:CR=1 FL=1